MCDAITGVRSNETSESKSNKVSCRYLLHSGPKVCLDMSPYQTHNLSPEMSYTMTKAATAYIHN